MAITEFTIGADVRCSDGEVCGHLTEVVLRSHAWTVTHLVVEPLHRSGLGRLVPLGLVDTVTDAIRLKCTSAEFDQLEHAERTALLPGSNGGYGGYGLGQAVPGAYVARSSFGVAGGAKSDAFDPVVRDTPPLGEIALHGVAVHATDGEIGHVRGVGVDGHHLAYVFLQEGHLWGRKKVAIPIAAVTGVDDGVHLNITKQQAEGLPAVDVRRAL